MLITLFRATIRRTQLFPLALIFALICGPGLNAYAEERATPSSVEADAVVFNRKIVTFRSEFLGASPEVRAKRGQARISDLLSTPGEHVVATTTIPQGIVISIDGHMAFGITPDDVDKLTQETLEAAASKAVLALTLVISETREGRDLKALGISGIYALIMTLAAYLIFRLAGLAKRKAHQWLNSKVDAHLTQLERDRLGGVSLLNRDYAITLLSRTVGLIYWGFVALTLYVWLGNLFARFPFTRAWGEQLNQFLLDVLSTIGGGIVSALPNLFVVIVIFLLTRLLTRGISDLFTRIGSGHTVVPWLGADIAAPTRRISIAILWIFALVMAYPYLPGSHSEAFKGVSVLLGLMVSIGASSHIGQVVSGLILTYTRVFRHGEYVQVAGYEGTVVDIGLIATRLRTGLGEELFLPNSLVLGAVTKNYSRAVVGPGFIVDTTVTIGYDTPWRQVEAMLIEAAQRTPGVLSNPAPQVFQTALSDFYPEYRLVCQAIPSEPRPRAKVMDMLHANIQDVFNEYKVQIMSPHYLGDPAEAKVVPKEKWREAPAAKES